MTAPTIRTEHAAAIRAVNSAFTRLPTSAQESVKIAYDGLEAEVDAAILADDRDRALVAIRAWRAHWLAEFERANR